MNDDETSNVSIAFVNVGRGLVETLPENVLLHTSLRHNTEINYRTRKIWIVFPKYRKTPLNHMLLLR